MDEEMATTIAYPNRADAALHVRQATGGIVRLNRIHKIRAI